MLQYCSDFIFPAKFVRINPYPLPYQEWEVLDFFAGLNFKSFHQLVYNKINFFIQLSKEFTYVIITSYCNPWKIYCCKAQISSSVDYFPGRVIDIAYYSCPAAHICYLCIRSTRSVIFEIERSIQKCKVREHSFGAYSAGKLEHIIVWISDIIINAFFNLKYLYREYGGFSIAKTCFSGQKKVFDNQPALGGNISTIIY